MRGGSTPWTVRMRAAAVLTACAAGLFVPLSGAAQAAEPSVDFTGGCGLLGIGSTSLPDTPSLRMTSGSGLQVVNHLGATATVLVNGRGIRRVRAGHSVRLTLSAQETTTVRLAPACPAQLISVAGTLTVAVEAVSAPITGTPSATPPETTSTPAPTGAPASPTPPPQRPAPATTAPQASGRVEDVATGPRPTPSGPLRWPGNRVSATRTVAAAVAPGIEVPGAAPAAPSGPPVQAIEPYIGPVSPLGADRAYRYSLALIATVLILGTGLAALRLLRSRRHVGAHRRAS